MSYIYAQIWMNGTPQCCGAHCQRPILDHSQAVVVTHSQGTMGFCSHHCFLQAFRPAPALPSPQEPSGDRDLLHAMGYRPPHEERAAE
jgi:hypothetical protein